MFFFYGFLVCYLLAFHQPTPHHVRVAVADPAAAAKIETALGKASPGAFDVVSAPTGDAARQSVLDRDTTAGFSAVPVQLVPGFFRALHPFLPMGNLIEAARGVFYFHGVGILRPILVLCAWVLVGVLLIAGHALWQRRRSDEAEEAVAEPPVEDPALEMPHLTALPAHSRHFGRLEPMVSGTVRTVDGEPVRRAVVTITDGRGQQLVRTIAGDDGGYAVTGLTAQFVDVVVSAPGLLSAVRRIPVREGVTRREDLALEDRRQPVAAGAGA